MAVLTFDIAAFRAAFPQFADVTDAQLENYWNIACLISGLNTDGSPISNLTSRQTILFLLVCHLATLAQTGDVMTGQLTSATEGSVSSGFAAFPVKNLTEAWYMKTQCGALYWQAMKFYWTGGRYYAFKRC